MTKQTFTTGQVLTAAQMTSLQQTAMGGGSTTAKTASYVLVAADAGTVVQMNAAGATTITVNTALFAAGDTVQIQNVGAGVCTVTAGTATVSTSATLALKQYDAGTLYFNTTSAAFFFAVDAADGMANPLTTTGDIIYSSSGSTAARLGIGSSAQVLTVASGIPSWATASPSAVTLISTVTLTTTATLISFTSIPGTYTHLRLTYQGQVNAGYGNLFLRFNADTGANYDYQTMDGVGATASAGQTFATNYISIGLIGVTVGGGTIDIPNYKATTLNKVAIGLGFMKYGTSSGNMIALNHGGSWRNSSAITQLDFTTDSANFTAGTVVTLFGES